MQHKQLFIVYIAIKHVFYIYLLHYMQLTYLKLYYLQYI